MRCMPRSIAHAEIARARHSLGKHYCTHAIQVDVPHAVASLADIEASRFIHDGGATVRLHAGGDLSPRSVQEDAIDRCSEESLA